MSVPPAMQARERTCVPQLQRSPASTSGRVTAKDRISHLERNMASLVALMKERHAPRLSSSDQAHQNFTTAVDNGLEERGDDIADTSSELRPAHLQLLFDHFAVESQLEIPDKDGDNDVTQIAMRMARVRLQRLLPSFDEVCVIAPFASDWMTLYYTLFPPSFAWHTGDQLAANYDRMHSLEVHPAALATYLLSVVITVQQMPLEYIPPEFHQSQGTTKFIEAVCKTVNNTVISNNTVSTNPESLEAAMLYVRVSLGRGSLKDTWLTLRRIVSLAELIGLPQAAQELVPISNAGESVSKDAPEQEFLRLKRNVWESICATDRNFSMMLNFPAATARYRFPHDTSIWQDGRISPQVYSYQLSNVCTAIFEIDELYSSNSSHQEGYEKVLRADCQLRALVASTPKSWWEDDAPDSTGLAESLVKFWHNYFMARIHLRPGMMCNSDGQYEYSRTACLNACQNAVRRFPKFRTRVPSGFFVCRLLDVQVFTAATFLLLSSGPQLDSEWGVQTQPYAASANVDSHTIQLVQGIVDCFASVCDTAGSDLAKEAGAALTLLISFVRGRHNAGLTEPILKVHIPLLGRIRIDPARTFQRTPTQHSIDSGAASVRADNDNEGRQRKSSENDVPVGNRYALSSPTATAAVEPVIWSLEFNDPSFWMMNDFNLDNILDSEQWNPMIQAESASI